MPDDLLPEIPSEEADRERGEVLARLTAWLETPMVLLGLVWLVLLVVELTRGLTPFLDALSLWIWALFVLDVGLKFAIAPRKAAFLRANWLTLLSLVLPALRVFRVVRALRLLRVARAARGVRFFRILTSLNRGMRVLGASMSRRGLPYVLGLSVLVLAGGAAGMYAFEQEAAGGGFDGYGDALWWTAMLLTSLGSEYWPETGAGRLLCFLLGVYGFAVFGYVTASLASFFVGRDAADDAGELPSAEALDALRAQVAALTEEVRALRSGRGEGQPGG